MLFAKREGLAEGEDAHATLQQLPACGNLRLSSPFGLAFLMVCVDMLDTPIQVGELSHVRLGTVTRGLTYKWRRCEK